ncbi:COX15/CtaA family protein [Arthrobacter roseus]|uniref:COX15/CtaA family protein n=1 Tax=Arthrobacter roseus TaxID=136274 RepID=UPI0019636C5D|nr:COX15/CtaA family protein [Arthrobacter roseus]MBM7848497.1 cytochrome c oxidase assembly protein subunit 15 [Arthrobacter roseus]
MTSTLQRFTAKLPTKINKVVRRLAVASLIGQTVLIVTGGAVRLTASGLGCPTWPRCTSDSLVNTPEMGIHGFIEFGNRTLTFALAAVAVLMLVFLWNIRRERRDLFLLALGLLASIPAQAIIGGITVLTKLNPWVVGLHFLVSIALVAVATLLVNRVYGRTGRGAKDTAHPTGKTLRQLSIIIVAMTAAAVIIGVIVTGAGPHAGDAATPRNGLGLEFISRIHVLPVYVLIAATVAAIVIALRQGASRRYQAALYLMATVLLLQAIIGYVQYFTGVPALLVGLHMLGSALLLASATNVADVGLQKRSAGYLQTFPTAK